MLTLSILFSLLECSSAFPTELQGLSSKNAVLLRRQLPILIPPFDATLQRVETAGRFAFVPPGKGDQRGPCPALNALANHNYLAHNGIATIPQFIEATAEFQATNPPSEDGHFKYTPGHERIPDNWYKRHPIDAYSSVYVQQDATYMTLKYPSLASVGGNTGKVNTYAGVDPGNLTGGVINSANLLQGNNAPCFLFQLAIQMLPDALEGLFHNISPALGLLAPVTSSLVDTLDCPQLDALNRGDIRTAFEKYPGYTKSYNGYRESVKKFSAPIVDLLGKSLGG